MMSWIFAAYFVYWMGSSLFFIYLGGRQYKVHLEQEERPDRLAAFITKEDYTRARNYELDLHRFRFVDSVFNLVTGAVKLLCFFLAREWNYTGRLANSMWSNGGEIWHSIVYMVMSELFEMAVDLPFAYYKTFVIEQRHGFNRKTHLFFLKDEFKELGVGLAIDILINTVLIGLVKLTASWPYAFVYAWIVMLAIHLALETVWPICIAPLFDNYATVNDLFPDSDLKRKIEALAARVGFPLKKIYVVQNSIRSAQSNAYMYGFWKNKRIVLYDTLLSDEYNKLLKPVWDALNPPTQDAATETDADADAGDDEAREVRGLTDDEVLSVLGHELGHWKLWHCVYEFLATELYSLFTLVIFSRLIHYKQLYNAFGFDSSQPVLIGYMLSSYVMAPVSQLYSLLWLYVSRRIEYAADRFSAELGYVNESISAEVKLSKDNRSMPIDDWLYAIFHRTHPSGPERVEAMKKFL